MIEILVAYEQAWVGCMIDKDAIRQRWDAVGSKLDERGQRLFPAVEVRTAGCGGLAAVSKINVLARSTINHGKADLTRNRCRRSKFAAPVAGVARFARTIRDWCRHLSGSWGLRRSAIPCGP